MNQGVSLLDLVSHKPWRHRLNSEPFEYAIITNYKPLNLSLLASD